MNNFPTTLTKLIERVKPYKWLLLPIIPTLLLIIFLLFLIARPSQRSSPNQFFSLSPTGGIQLQVHQNDIEGKDTSDAVSLPKTYQKKESLPDGSTAYSYNSGNPSRPHLEISSSDDQIVFSRAVASKDFPLSTISTYNEAYGGPDKTITGSKIYGKNAVTLIYASVGVAIIGDPQTDEVFEKQTFVPMTADQYIQKYGYQN